MRYRANPDEVILSADIYNEKNEDGTYIFNPTNNFHGQTGVKKVSKLYSGYLVEWDKEFKSAPTIIARPKRYSEKKKEDSTNKIEVEIKEVTRRDCLLELLEKDGEIVKPIRTDFTIMIMGEKTQN